MNITIASIDPVTLTARTITLSLTPGMTAREAAYSAGFPHADSFAVYICRVDPAHIHRDGDRLDLGSALLIDPKQARRLRAQNSQPQTKRTLARHGGRHQLAS